jgi:hypothetical protein
MVPSQLSFFTAPPLEMPSLDEARVTLLQLLVDDNPEMQLRPPWIMVDLTIATTRNNSIQMN